MQRLLALALWILVPLSAAADGKVFPTVLAAEVKIPDQRALIHFTNGVERLVIETRFTGSGTNFAWVVPLPSQPVVEEASTGLFPTLQYLFRPEIVHRVPRYYVAIIIVLGFGFMAYVLVRVTSGPGAAVVIFVLLLLLAAILLPGLATAKSRGVAGGDATDQPVSILERSLVGVFETTTISSRDPKALQTWLRENGFAMSSSSEPVIESYVKDGWVFVAAKVRRDKVDAETSTPHPLSFTFRTERAVYPMRLTGVDNDSLQVDLYVFGTARAKAPHFKVERCTLPTYPEVMGEGSSRWRRWSPGVPNIAHPLLRKWVGGSPVATKLTAKLSPASMRQDVWLDWTPYSEEKNQIFSRQGAVAYGLNLGAGAFATGVLLLSVFAAGSETRKRRFPQRCVGVLICGIFLTGCTYLILPKIEVRLVRNAYGTSQSQLFYFGGYLMDGPPVTRADLSAEARRLLTNSTNDLPWLRHIRHSSVRDGWQNFLIGGEMREEDSPGNFTLREHGEELEFVIYDPQGAEYTSPFLTRPLKREP